MYSLFNNNYLNRIYIFLLYIHLTHEQYISSRINLNDIDTLFLSSISTSTSYTTNTISNIKNVQNLVYFKNYLYVGAENWLLKINTRTFKIEQSIRYGPLYDSTSCRYNPVDECPSDNTKTLVNNYNKLILVYEQKNLLLTCWTARQGVCDLRDLDDLNKLIVNSSIPAVPNDPVNSTIAFIASSANSQDLLYIGSTFNNNGPYRAEVPALSGRSLSQPKFMQILTYSQGLKSSKASIEFISRFMKTFIVKYIDAFNLGIYNYFLTVQNTDTDSAHKGELLNTKISRLCLNDLSFTKSYTEIPLKCTGSKVNSLRPVDYNELISGKIVQINSDYFLVGLFEKSKRTNFNSSLTGSRQALCVFNMKEIQVKFKENIKKCYQSDGMRGLNFIKPDQKCGDKKLRLNDDINDDFCSSPDNGLYPIGGQLPVQSNSVLEFQDESFESLQLDKNSVLTTLVLYSKKSLSFYNYDGFRFYRKIELTPDMDSSLPVVQNLNFDESGNLYLINKNEILKIKQSQCEKYTSCQACLSPIDEPLCGWCTETSTCTSFNECPVSKWLKTNTSSLCYDILSIRPLEVLKTTSEWLEIDFRTDLNLDSNSSYNCVFKNLDEMTTNALVVSGTRLKCPIPHSSLLEKYFNPNSTEMSLNEDGIFMQQVETTPHLATFEIYVKNSGSFYGQKNFNLTVIDCGVYKSCVTCSSKCSWCNGKCVNQGSCTGQTCSSFDPGTNKLLIPYTAHRQQAPLIIQKLNFIDSDFECHLTWVNGLRLSKNITVPFVDMNTTHSSCVLTNIFEDLEHRFLDGQVQTNLRIYDVKHDLYIDSISNKLSLLFYKCELKGSDCSSCLSINRQLSCMYCQNSGTPSCRFMNSHSKLAVISQCIGPSNTFISSSSQCEKPEITSLNPVKIPISGGTVLTVSGVNLGQNFDDIIKIGLKCESGYVECDLIQANYIPGKVITCKIRPSQAPSKSCRIQLRVKSGIIISGSTTTDGLLISSSQTLDLVDPILSETDPGHLIQSANFVWLTLKGVDLDAGKTREVIILDNFGDFKQKLVKCDIKNVTSESIRCRLNEKFQSLGKKNLRLVIDDFTINSHVKVNSDPLVKTIDTHVTFVAGGTKFKLTGFNFDSVQSAYTFINYKDLWYSEPVPARDRVSNEIIEFEFPGLSDAFFALTKPDEKYLLQIGFLMDGFNVTLKDQVIEYTPNLTPNTFKITEMSLLKNKDDYVLRLNIIYDTSLYNILNENLNVFIGCSLCERYLWDKNIYMCNLPELKFNKDRQCEQKVLNYLSTVSEMNRLVSIFIGNIRIENEVVNDENLSLYTQSYVMNNVDGFQKIVKYLSQTTGGGLWDSMTKKYETSIARVSDPEVFNFKNVFIILSILSCLTIVLIIASLSLGSFLVKRKKGKNLIYKLGSKKSRLEFDLIQSQIDQLEVSIRPKCTVLYQQLHTDYLNDLNNDLIYTLNGLPVWNFKTYLFNFLFPSTDLNYPVYVSNLMCSSSMSNSTTNTLLSTTNTPVQKQNMSVYATIKSSSMLRFDPLETETTNRTQFMAYGNIGEAMFLFDQLIHNKNFLTTLISVCEKEPCFTPKDRNTFASLLTLALKDNLQFLYSIVKLLLSDHVKSNLTDKKPVLKSNESLIEPLLNDFISLFMYDYQRDSQCALHLYRLVKSLKFYISMAPCDSVKNLGLNSLNSETMLPDQPYSVIYVNVVLNPGILSSPNNKNLYVIPLVDTDTISQCKQKISDFVFKKSNLNQFCFSSRPDPRDFDLELCLILLTENPQQTTLITLKETEDELMNTESQFKRLLTLKDYNIQNGSFINLNFKNSLEHKDHVYMSTMSMNNEYVLYASSVRAPPLGPPPQAPDRYHLVKPQDNYSNNSSLETTKKKKKKYEKLLTVKSQDSAVTNLIKSENPVNKLSRLLTNKGTLQPFIDQFIESIFSNTQNLPPVIHNLFEFMDTEIKKYGNLKTEETHKLSKLCKINVYFLRYWTNLIRNPNLILDVEKTSLVDSSLQCIAQAFIDSCTSGNVHNLYETNSPVNRLLFIRDVPKYKDMIDQFFVDLKSTPSTSDHELHFYLNEFSKCKAYECQSQMLGATLGGQGSQTELNTVQVLLQLYEYYEKYQHQINAALGQQQCSILLPVHHRLVQIKDLMSMSTLAGQTMNRTGYFNTYQQPVNCYATTSDLLVNLSGQANVQTIQRSQFQTLQQQQFF